MKNLGQINDPKDIVTKEYVDTQISNSEVDLTDYVKNTDYATDVKHGLIKGDYNFGVRVNGTGAVYVDKASNEMIDAKANQYKPIVPSNLEYAVKSVGDGYYALASTITALENRIAQLETQLAGVEAQLAEI